MRAYQILLISVALTLFISCAGMLSGSGQNPAKTQGPVLTLPSSLHGTASGMRWWYERPGGLGSVVSTPFNQTNCGSCHAKGCEDCHSAGGSGPVDQPTVCISCHSRGSAKYKIGENDVHFAAGMKCSDCHANDIHGHTTTYNTMYDDGAVSASCEGCHVDGNAPKPPDDTFHTQHGDKVSCDACHLKTQTTCYNCHMDSLVDDNVNKQYKEFSDFVILLNDKDGKVHAGTYQAVVKGGKTFVAYGPYQGHAISAVGRTCGDCHDSARMVELKDTGKIVMTSWDATVNPATDKPEGIVHATGVIPFAPDKYEFQFLNFDKATGEWAPLKTQLDGSQYEFCTPLTDQQLEALGAK